MSLFGIDVVKVVLDAASTVALLAIVMTIGGVFKEIEAVGSVYSVLKRVIKTKRGLVAALRVIFGVLPIQGRISFTCFVLDALNDKTHNNQKMGSIAFLAAHHFYLWSPLEKAIIITCSILGITYWQFMSVMWPAAAIAILFMIVYTFTSVTEDEIHLTEPEDPRAGSLLDVVLLFIAIGVVIVTGYGLTVFGLYALYLVLKNKVFSLKWYDKKVLAIAFSVIVVSALVNSYHAQMLAALKGSSLSQVLLMAVFAAYVLAFISGSSAKYAAVCGLLTQLMGIKYLVLFYLVDFCGYLVSPMHDCVAIGKYYFKTPLGMFFTPLLGLSIILIVYASLAVLIG